MFDAAFTSYSVPDNHIGDSGKCGYGVVVTKTSCGLLVNYNHSNDRYGSAVSAQIHITTPPNILSLSTSVRYYAVLFTMRYLCTTLSVIEYRQTIVSWHRQIIQCFCLIK